MKKFNFKNPRTLIILVSAFIVVVLILGLIFGICTKYNKNNTKEAETEYVSKESETKKNDSEKSLVNNIESSTEQTTEEITTENYSEENTTEEASTEKIIASDNEITVSNNENNYNDNSYSDNSSSNNDAYQSDSNTNNSGNDDSDNSSSYEPTYTPPSNNEIAEPQAHIVYKEDGTWDLQNTYFDNSKACSEFETNNGNVLVYITETNEFKNFINENNLNGFTHIQAPLSSRGTIYIDSFNYIIFTKNNDRIKVRYNRSSNYFYIIN